MLKDITLGQYFPGNSLLHKVDPRYKILSVIVMIIGTFMAKTAIAFFALFLFTILLVAVSHISFKIVMRGLKTIIFIIAFTAILNLFFTSGQIELFAWDWSFIHIRIYEEGIVYAAIMVVRIAILLVSTSVILSYTTSPIALTDGIESLLAPLKIVHLPVHEFAMMMTIALRFIPTLIEETDKIMSAQKARGADFESGNLIKRVKALLPILIPLFISAFRRADELATAMECRCYKGGKGRTKMTKLRTKPWDVIFLLLLIVFAVGIFFINKIMLPSPLEFINRWHI